MAKKRRKSLKRKLYTIAFAAVLLFCLVIECGQLFPSLGIPDWDTLFTQTGLFAPTVTPQGELQVHFIDVGNADSILIRQGETNALIDAGERGDGDEILAYLNKHGVKKLDLVIATHPHADHIGGMTDVINGIEVDKFMMSFMSEEETPTSATYLNMLTALDERRVTVEEAKPGAVYTLGTAQLFVLAPLSASDNANDISVVTRLNFGDHNFLLMGDAETPVEKDLLSNGTPLSADVLKVGHHGSDTSSSEMFLNRVSPRFAVITCGAGNSYGHPHQKVLDRLAKRDVQIYRNDAHGHIVFTSDGKEMSVTTQK